MEDKFVIVDEAGNVVSYFDTYEEAFEHMEQGGFLEPVIMTLEEYSRIDNR